MRAPNYLAPEIACRKLVRHLETKGIIDQRVLEAFQKVPRHLFLDEAMWSKAYDDITLPIGLNQTISQPYIVALMTQLLDIYSGMKILEVGTGSGFQTAILAQFTHHLYTIERFEELSYRAEEVLNYLKLNNIGYRIGDGTQGWPEVAPFDRIIVTAGAPAVPEPLLKQLAPNGKLLIPTGDRNSQHLELYHKKESIIERKRYDNVLFVPLVGENGWETEEE